MMEKTGFKDDLVMNLEFMTAKLLKLASPTVSNELIEIFLDKFEEIYPDKFQKKINDIAKDLNKNFTKILLSIDEDLDKPTTH